MPDREVFDSDVVDTLAVGAVLHETPGAVPQSPVEEVGESVGVTFGPRVGRRDTTDATQGLMIVTRKLREAAEAPRGVPTAGTHAVAVYVDQP